MYSEKPNMFTKLLLDLLPLSKKWVVTLSLWHLKVHRRESLLENLNCYEWISVTEFETAVNKTILLPCSYFLHWSAPGASLRSSFLPILFFFLFVKRTFFSTGKSWAHALSFCASSCASVSLFLSQNTKERINALDVALHFKESRCTKRARFAARLSDMVLFL